MNGLILRTPFKVTKKLSSFDPQKTVKSGFLFLTFAEKISTIFSKTKVACSKTYTTIIFFLKAKRLALTKE